MSLNNIEKLEMLEWLDDFIKQRMTILKREPLPDEELIEIYEEQIKWNETQRIMLANKVLNK